jgi:hypothetical protein
MEANKHTFGEDLELHQRRESMDPLALKGRHESQQSQQISVSKGLFPITTERGYRNQCDY